ncbi:MAG TPA: SDR family NAD(P)-dependent oxidoreductase, partial [Polyangiaceae bacterium LLY-WYZ-15_(1-7)]|nr:SDR family NAD(P)-dependent oxidoreductase [Polyangiaceae bacterium LLY-WYZ-15_(1-7)]
MSTHVIVGANRGIGLELAKQLHAKEDQKVIATCRKSSEGLNATGAEVHEGVDVTSDEAVAAFAAKMKGRELDGLIVNAGVLERNTLAHLDFDSIRKQLEVNALGPLRVVAALRDALEDGAKVAIITSRMGSIADNGSGGKTAYRMSKAALNMGAKNPA